MLCPNEIIMNGHTQKILDVYHSTEYNSEDLETTKMFQSWGLVK